MSLKEAKYVKQMRKLYDKFKIILVTINHYFTNIKYKLSSMTLELIFLKDKDHIIYISIYYTSFTFQFLLNTHCTLL